MYAIRKRCARLTIFSIEVLARILYILCNFMYLLRVVILDTSGAWEIIVYKWIE